MCTVIAVQKSGDDSNILDGTITLEKDIVSLILERSMDGE